jgi:hypothetical protein
MNGIENLSSVVLLSVDSITSGIMFSELSLKAVYLCLLFLLSP